MKAALAILALASLSPLLAQKKETAKQAQTKAVVWESSRAEQHTIRRQGVLYEDAALEVYLESIARKLYPEIDSGPWEFSIKIVKDPSLNAFAYPNGAVYLHSGILAAIENEAQAATVIGHEVYHFIDQHGVVSYRKAKAKAAWQNGISIASELAGASYVSLVGAIAFNASISGHSRELEREADHHGMLSLHKAGYAIEEASKSYQHLQLYIAEEKLPEPYLFSSHPRLSERASNIESTITKHLLSDDFQLGFIGEEIYFERTDELLLENARMDIELSDFPRAQRALDRYERLGGTNARTCLLQGELCRMRAEAGDPEKALARFRQGLALAPRDPELNRAVGTLLHQLSQWKDARPHLELSLELDPRHPRAGFTKHYLEQCIQNSKPSL